MNPKTCGDCEPGDLIDVDGFNDEPRVVFGQKVRRNGLFRVVSVDGPRMQVMPAVKMGPIIDALYTGLGAAMLVEPRSEPVIEKIKAALDLISKEPCGWHIGKEADEKEPMMQPD